MNATRFFFTVVLAILVGTALSSCSMAPIQSIRETADVEEANILSTRILSRAQDARDFCIRSILAVMQANGGNPITAGTYRMHPDRSGEYLAAPDDQLLVITPDGRQVEMIVVDFKGKISRDEDQFLTNPYQLKVIYQAPGWDNFMLIASRLNDGTSLEVSGWVRLVDKDFQVYLTRQAPGAPPASGEAGESSLGETVQGVIASGERSFQVDLWIPLTIALEK